MVVSLPQRATNSRRRDPHATTNTNAQQRSQPGSKATYPRPLPRFGTHPTIRRPSVVRVVPPRACPYVGRCPPVCSPLSATAAPCLTVDLASNLASLDPVIVVGIFLPRVSSLAARGRNICTETVFGGGAGLPVLVARLNPRRTPPLPTSSPHPTSTRTQLARLGPPNLLYRRGRCAATTYQI